MQYFVKHLLKIDSDHIESVTLPILNRLYNAGLITHRCNNKPFPIRECAAVVQVSDDDPRGKKPGAYRKKSLTLLLYLKLH